MMTGYGRVEDMCWGGGMKEEEEVEEEEVRKSFGVDTEEEGR